MRILVDAMGGDNAPDQIALGAIQAAKDFGCEVVLVGRGEAILRALKDQGIETLPKGVEIANADDVVDMHDDPATVVKKKKDSSMVVGLNMLKEGGGDAFVSAGSTGALLSAAPSWEGGKDVPRLSLSVQVEADSVVLTRPETGERWSGTLAPGEALSAPGIQDRLDRFAAGMEGLFAEDKN